MGGGVCGRVSELSELMEEEMTGNRQQGGKDCLKTMLTFLVWGTQKNHPDAIREHRRG